MWFSVLHPFLRSIVRNCKRSKNFLYLKAKKLAYHHFTDAGRRHKTPMSETKDFLLLMAQQASLALCLHWFSLPLSPIEATWSNPGGYYIFRGFVSQPGNSKIFIINARKPAQTLSQKKALSLSYWTAFCSGRRDTLSSMAIQCAKTLKKLFLQIVQNKSCLHKQSLCP